VGEDSPTNVKNSVKNTEFAHYNTKALASCAGTYCTIIKKSTGRFREAWVARMWKNSMIKEILTIIGQKGKVIILGTAFWTISQLKKAVTRQTEQSVAERVYRTYMAV
jgi:CTP:phosphocholine cytidylyltransferase-like protein